MNVNKEIFTHSCCIVNRNEQVEQLKQPTIFVLRKSLWKLRKIRIKHFWWKLILWKLLAVGLLQEFFEIFKITSGSVKYAEFSI